MMRKAFYGILIISITVVLLIGSEKDSFGWWGFGDKDTKAEVASKTLEQLERELKLEHKRRTKAEKLAGQYQETIFELQEKLKQKTDSNLQKAVDTLKEQVQYEQAEKERLHKQTLDMQEMLTSSEKQIGGLQSQLTTLQEQLQVQAQAKESFLQQIKTLQQGQKDTEKKISNLRNQAEMEKVRSKRLQQQQVLLFLASFFLLFVAYKFGTSRGKTQRNTEKGSPKLTDPVLKAQTASQAPSRPTSLEKNQTEASSDKIFDEFPLTSELIQKIKREIPEKTGKTPTESQWKMILSKSLNTYVVAGAGSGKSTSLILRILVLNHYLRIPLKRLTVFSFTRESTKEFRQKLRDVFQVYGKNISEREATQVVRTFHSKILELARGKFPQSDFFEFLAKQNDLGNAGLFENSLNDTQEQYLKETYKSLFHNNKEFHSLILNLYQGFLDGQNWGIKTYSEEIISLASERDDQVTRAVEDVFDFPYGEREHVSFPLSGVYKHITFYANAYIPELGWYIIYIPQTRLLGVRKDEKIHNFSLGGCLTVKKNILVKFSDVQIKFVHNEHDLSRITEEIEWFQNNGHQFTPIFPYMVEGEITSAIIWEAFYAFAIFVESMGIEVQDLSRVVDDESLSSTDRTFVKALVLFWAAFVKQLKSDRIIRFHDLFSFLSEKHPENFKQLSRSALDTMAHTMIDEFQDISPEVVHWIRGTFSHQQSSGIPSSLMCVGDDWQSIYGWKGSSPRYFIDYETTFSTPPANRVDIMENFRSYQNILGCAERVLEDIAYKIDKHSSAVRGNSPVSDPVQLIISNDEEEIHANIRKITRDERDSSKSIMIMARANRVLRQLKAEFGGERNIKILTYHQSKGLEADICILVGDCVYDNTIPLKNLVYEVVGFPQTFDQAQAEEALRLAYVALTRARDRCYWIGVPKAGGALTKLDGESSKAPEQVRLA